MKCTDILITTAECLVIETGARMVECFAVHKTPKGASFRVTHAPSGLQAGDFDRHADAVFFAGLLLCLDIPWGESKASILARSKRAFGIAAQLQAAVFAQGAPMKKGDTR